VCGDARRAVTLRAGQADSPPRRPFLRTLAAHGNGSPQGEGEEIHNSLRNMMVRFVSVRWKRKTRREMETNRAAIVRRQSRGQRGIQIGLPASPSQGGPRPARWPPAACTVRVPGSLTRTSAFRPVAPVLHAERHQHPYHGNRSLRAGFRRRLVRPGPAEDGDDQLPGGLREPKTPDEDARPLGTSYSTESDLVNIHTGDLCEEA
jgi:hypothetical protein